MAENKRILLYFGSFNPIHNGHIAIAEYAVEKGLADEVVLIVSPQNPVKNRADLASELHRFEMVEIAVAESKYPSQILLSGVELTLPRPSYTIDTLRFLKAEFPDTTFALLMGGDLIGTVPQWKEGGAILSEYDIYVYPRPHQNPEIPKGRVTILEGTPPFDISSTEIRKMAAEGKNIDALVPKGVSQYVKKFGLWQ